MSEREIPPEPRPGEIRDAYRAHVESEAYRGERPRKARVIAHLCESELRTASRIGDLGTGTGLIKKELETIFSKSMIGFDMDRSFIEVEKRVSVADVQRLPLRDGTLDFVIANHLYEHVEDQDALFREMFRVLVPGGAAYVSAGNRLMVMEPHYRLPFLSWLPRAAADRYVRWTGRGRGYRGIRFRTYRPLVDLMRGAGFTVVDETERALTELLGRVWGERWRRIWRVALRLPDRLLDQMLRWLSPQWFFMLRKPESG